MVIKNNVLTRMKNNKINIVQSKFKIKSSIQIVQYYFKFKKNFCIGCCDNEFGINLYTNR